MEPKLTGSEGSKSWIFTINNYTNDDIKWVNNLEVNQIYVAKETCPTTGTPHLQGEVVFKRKYRLTALKKLHPTAHFKVKLCKDFNYTNKVGNEFVRRENNGKQGKRTDLEGKIEEIKKNGTFDHFCPEYVKYHGGFGKLEDEILRKKFRNWMTECDYYYGKTGTGKSHKAFEGYNPETHYVWKLNDKDWQDGYTGQKIVIINDFRGEIKYNELLNLIDKWPYTVPRRGREPAPFLAEKIIITSSLHPKLIYKNREKEDELEQLLRRINLIEMK